MNYRTPGRIIEQPKVIKPKKPLLCYLGLHTYDVDIGPGQITILTCRFCPKAFEGQTEFR